MTAPYGGEPIHGERLGDTVMTVWAVRWNNRDSYQVYAYADGSYELVGIHQQYETALVDCRCWINELADGAPSPTGEHSTPTAARSPPEIRGIPQFHTGSLGGERREFHVAVHNWLGQVRSLAHIDAIADERADDLLVNALLPLRNSLSSRLSR